MLLDYLSPVDRLIMEVEGKVHFAGIRRLMYEIKSPITVKIQYL